jgi:hypothetical protein
VESGVSPPISSRRQVWEGLALMQPDLVKVLF